MLLFTRFIRSAFLLCLLCCLTMACSTGQGTDSKRMALALRYLRAIDAGQYGLESVGRLLDETAKNEPAAAEITRRALADVTASDLEKTAAPVYAKHFSEAELLQLVMFAETPAGRMFYHLIYQDERSGKKTSAKEKLKLFKPEEISQLDAFSRTEAAATLVRETPAIRQELDTVYKQLGADAMRRYLQKTPPRSKTPTPVQPDDPAKPEDKQNLHDDSWMLNA